MQGDLHWIRNRLLPAEATYEKHGGAEKDVNDSTFDLNFTVVIQAS